MRAIPRGNNNFRSLDRLIIYTIVSLKDSINPGTEQMYMHAEDIDEGIDIPQTDVRKTIINQNGLNKQRMKVVFTSN